MPVQGGPGGPSNHVWSRARQTGTTGANTSSLLRDKPREIVTSLRDEQEPGASLRMPSSRDALASRGSTSVRDALSSRGNLVSRNALRPTLLPEPPLAPAKTPVFASTAWLRGLVLVAGGALALLWVTPANQQADEEAAPVSLRQTPRPAAQSVAAERAPDPSAAAEQGAVTGAALYQRFLKWRQLRGG